MPQIRPLQPGTSIAGEFRIESVLGLNESCIIYSARTSALNRADLSKDTPVIVREFFPKTSVGRRENGFTIIAGSSWEHPNEVRRFQESVQAVADVQARLHHPSIEHVHNCFTEDGGVYVISEFIDGFSLTQYRKREAAGSSIVPQAKLDRMARGLVDALEALHSNGVVHRDIKPSNIRIRSDGDAVLIDFGASKIEDEADEDVVRSEPFASPEQFSGGPIGPWSDIYSLAATLYHAITGSALNRVDPDALWDVTRWFSEGWTPQYDRTKPYSDFGVSDSFAQGLAWALAPDPARRPPSAGEWAKLLFRDPFPVPLESRTDGDLRAPHVPAQGAGPHFTIQRSGLISFAPTEELDRGGNDIARLNALHEPIAEAARDLADGLSPRANQYTQLASVAKKYLEQVAQDPAEMDFAVLYGVGLRLEVAEAATRRLIDNGIAPPLDETEERALRNLLLMHGPFVLASGQGRQLLADAERYHARADDVRHIREHALSFAQELVQRPDMVDLRAAEFVLESAASIGNGPHDERVVQFTLHSVANFMVVAAELSIALLLLGSGNVVTLGGAWALLKSRPDSEDALRTAESIFSGMHKTAVAFLKNEVPRFLLDRQHQLRGLATMSPLLSFVPRFLDWLDKQIESGAPDEH